MAKNDRTPLMAGNWKMNLNHQEAVVLVQKLAWTLSDKKHDYSKVEVAVLPPYTDLRSVQTLIDGDRLEIRYGAQDVSAQESGAYTGEISATFLAQLACRYVIVGHSERRTLHGETDEQVAAKSAAAVQHGIVPVICVGETAADLEEHGASAVPVAQLRVALQGLPKGADVVVAYEPVWAIGTGKVATTEQAQEVHKGIREWLNKELGQQVAESTRIIYGGSVSEKNCRELAKAADIDGFLVGGASLKPAFVDIINANQA